MCKRYLYEALLYFLERREKMEEEEKRNGIRFIELLILKHCFYRSHFRNKIIMSIFLHSTVCHSPNSGGLKHLGFTTVN